MPKTFKVAIEPDVAEVLKNTRTDGDRVYLPDMTKDRPLYLRTMKVLEQLGIAWVRKLACHVAPGNARELLDAAMGAGAVVDRKKTLQFFETPRDVAGKLCQMAEIEDFTGAVLEPSAGRGALAVAIRDYTARYGTSGAKVQCCEIDDSNVRALRELGFETDAGDFLGRYRDGQFLRIVANPPFTGGQDVAHVMEMFRVLGTGGTLASVVSGGVIGGHPRSKALREFQRVLQIYGRAVKLPDGSFKSAKTDVATAIVVLQKK